MDLVERLDAYIKACGMTGNGASAHCADVRDAKAEIERLREKLHYANGTCDLAMKHRDEAEAGNDRLRIIVADVGLEQRPALA